MKIIKLLDLKRILLMYNAASTDETRYHLNGVNVKPGIIEATDGHILVQCKTSIDYPIYFSSDVKSQLKVFVGSFGRLVGDDLELEIDDNLTLKNPLNGMTISLKTSFEVRYPNTDAFFNKAEIKPIDEICLNPDLLTRIGKAMGLKKNKGLKFKFRDKISPIEVYSISEEHNDYKAILMPMRG